MAHQQLDFIYPYPAGEGMHPYAPVLLHPLGLRFEPELINDLCMFLFDMLGLKFHDVTPTTVDYKVTWDDPREVDIHVPGGDKSAVWAPQLPPGIVIDPRTGHMTGTLPEGVWEWTVHVGPQIKYDACGGDAGPYGCGQWIGALEEREQVKELPTASDISTLTPEQKDALLQQLLAEKQHSDETQGG